MSKNACDWCAQQNAPQHPRMCANCRAKCENGWVLQAAPHRIWICVIRFKTKRGADAHLRDEAGGNHYRVKKRDLACPCAPCREYAAARKDLG